MSDSTITRAETRDRGTRASAALGLLLAAAGLAAAGPSAVRAGDLLAQEWSHEFDAGNESFVEMAVGSGDVTYVTGNLEAAGNRDIVTYALDAAGSMLWSQVFDGPGGAEDLAYGLTIDDTFVYVVGRATTESAEPDFVTLKYRRIDGTLVWMRLHDPGSSVLAQANDVVVGDAGRVFVTGIAFGDGADYETVAYDAAGNLLWNRKYDGPGSVPFSNDTAEAIALLPDGDVVVTGVSSDAAGRDDYATLRYDGATGAQEWLHRYTGAGGNDAAQFIATDGSGDVYVSGISFHVARSVATLRYDGDTGALLWDAIDNPGFEPLRVHAMLVEDGNVYLTGLYDIDGNDDNFNNDLWLRKRAATDGALIWATSYGDSGFNDNDWGTDLALSANSLYVAGRTRSFGAQNDYLVQVYDAGTGTLLETETYDDGANSFDIAVDLDIAPSGNVLVGGSTSVDPSNETDIVVLRFTTGGVVASAPGVVDAGVRPVLYPNPALLESHVVLALPPSLETGLLHVSLFDVTGRTHASLELEQSRQVAMRIPTAGLTSGVYYVRVRADAWSRTLPLRLVR